MLRLPATFAARYRLANEREVHSCSFGLVTSVRRAGATGWEQRIGTLDDERIFGPLRDLECACGKYRGAKHRGTICEWCGVKATTRDERRSRFGHIDLPMPIPHPLGDETDLVTAVPVLPAAFLESHAGNGLACVYEQLVAALDGESRTALRNALQGIIDRLLPAVLIAHEWGLAESPVLTRGLVLEVRADLA